jgi:hypothetical protein
MLIRSLLSCLLIPLHVSAFRCHVQGVIISLFITYSSSSALRVGVGAYGVERGVHRVLVGKPEGNRPLGRPRRRWEDNIKMHVQEVGGARGDWMELAQDRDRWRALVSTVKNLRVP